VSDPFELSWLPMYGERFYGSETVQTAGLAAEGAYHRLLWHQWRKGSVPEQEEKVRRILGNPPVEGWPELWAFLVGWFPTMTDRSGTVDLHRRQNPRLEEIRAEQLEKSRAARSRAIHASKAARARWDARASNEHAESHAQPMPEHAQIIDTRSKILDTRSKMLETEETGLDAQAMLEHMLGECPERPTPAEYLRGCVVAVNRGFRANLMVEHPREIATSTQVGKVTWQEDGIPLAVALEQCFDAARLFEPKHGDPQFTSLRYCDRSVRAVHDAKPSPRTQDALAGVRELLG